MAKKIRLVFGACCLLAAQHDAESKLHLMHEFELVAKCGFTCRVESILISVRHLDNITLYSLTL